MWSRRAHLSPLLQRGVQVRVQEALALRASDGDPNNLTFAPSSAPGRAGIPEEASAEALLQSSLHWHHRGVGAWAQRLLASARGAWGCWVRTPPGASWPGAGSALRALGDSPGGDVAPDGRGAPTTQP